MLKQLKKLTTAVLAVSALFAARPEAWAVTNYFNFTTTSLGANVGPNNPANGSVAIYGTNLNVGDVALVDVLVVNPSPDVGGDWGAVDLNGSGTGGVTGATLGVLVRDGGYSGTAYVPSVWTSGSSANFGTYPAPPTNRVQIVLTCTSAGSTTNLSYTVNYDEGYTGTLSSVQSGSVTFPNNVIPLSLGSRNEPQTFTEITPYLQLSALPTNTYGAGGFTATFAESISIGFPISTAQQWYSNGVAIPGATNLSYTTPTLTSAYNGGQYYVIVTNLLQPSVVVTSVVSTLNVRTTPGIVQFPFANTVTAPGFGGGLAGYFTVPGSELLAGDTVVVDAIITPDGGQASDAWTSVALDAGSSYGGLFDPNSLGVLVRMGSGNNPSQLFTNGVSGTNPTASSAATNRVRIELYPSQTGSTTNMGYLVEIDQNLSGTFQPAVTGTNLTFTGNVIPLQFGSSGNYAFVTQNPQSPVSIFSQPGFTSPLPLAVGASGVSVGVTVKGWSPAFQWRKNGVAISGATNEVYNLPTIANTDNGSQFAVVVSNKLNSANVVTSSVATLTVTIPNNLTWYPVADYTTWDTATANWTTNSGASQLDFTAGQNVTFDSLGYDISGNYVTITNAINVNAVNVNLFSGTSYQFSGAGAITGQSLAVNGDGSGSLILQDTSTASFNNLTINDATVEVGYLGVDGKLAVSGSIVDNGTLIFNDASTTLNISANITGSGVINQNGAGTTVLSGTNSTVSIGSINNGSLSIASPPGPGAIVNDGVLEPVTSASSMLITNSVSGTGYYWFVGFQPTIVTGVSSHTGQNLVYWSQVTVNNPQAFGDVNAGSTDISGGDRFGGLYLSNNINWSQPLILETRSDSGTAQTAAHIYNESGTNTVSSPISFVTGQAAGVYGSEINIEAATGLLTVSGTVTNTMYNSPEDLNLQGAGTGIWSSVLSDSIYYSLNLLKRGAGTWTLNGAHTYTGTTTVSGGTLLLNGQITSPAAVTVSGGTLGGTGSITGPVTVTSGGTIAPGGTGSGVLTLSSNLSLAGSASFLINKTAGTSDAVSGITSLTYGGTLVVSNVSGTLAATDSFKLFNASTYAGTFSAISPATPGTGLVWNTNTLTTDGTLRIAVGSVVNTSRTNITSVVSGGALHLSWPADHTGWILEAQTNAPGVGLKTNWVRIPGTSSANTYTATIGTNGSVFFRLVYP